MTSAMMRASRFHAAGEPLSLESIAMPEPGPGEVLVRVHAAGLCGSDVHIAIEGFVPTAFVPITLGHEPAGVIERLGAGVEGWREGERVAVMSGIYCGECRACLTGRPTL